MIRYPVLTAPSRIQGHGIFAAQVIPGRAKIGEVTGSLIPRQIARQQARRQPRIYLVDVSHTRTLDCSRGNLLRLLNHSCAPNAFLRIIRCRLEVYARRTISVGEEITVDYGATPHPQGMRCSCGQPTCRRRI